jgi:hypothetical protein
MYSYELNTFGPQLQEIVSEAHKHLGKNTIFFFRTILKIIYFFCLDQCQTCDRNGGPAKESLDHKYVNFIERELLPELNLLAAKYAKWWTFKPFSLLKLYLNDREIVLDEYFSLDELQEKVFGVLKNSSQYFNSDVIVLMDEEQQKLFDSWYIFVPDIVKDHLMAHIVAAPDEIAKDLQNKHMTENFYVESPMDIIYKDPSSVFWIPPYIDFAINKSTGNVYSWNRLLFLFTEFCFNNTEYFTRHSNTIIGINENTLLTSVFSFKYFHLSQIETILKKVTKFLGRKNSMIQNCHFIRHTPLVNVTSNKNLPNVFTFIDDIINNNNCLMPSLSAGLYL